VRPLVPDLAADLNKPLPHQKFTIESIIAYVDIWRFGIENLRSIGVFISHGDILGYRCFG